MPRLLTAHLGATFAFLYIPILVLMVLSFNRAGLPTAWGGFSLEWYGKLATNPKILASAWNSVIVASISTAIATAIGTMLALGVERSKPSAARDAFLFAPMIIPDIVLAIALLSFFTLIKFALGLQSIILSHVVFNIAFVCAVVRARLRNFDWSLTRSVSRSRRRVVHDVLANHASADLASGHCGGLAGFHAIGRRIHHCLFHGGCRAILNDFAHADLCDDPVRRDAGN